MTDDAGLFSQEEQALVRRVERSQVWRLIRDTLAHERELLFATDPKTTEELWAQRGAISQVTRLLREGSSLVVYYQRFMAAEAERKAAEQRQTAVARGERVYTPGSAAEEPPQFDL